MVLQGVGRPGVLGWHRTSPRLVQEGSVWVGHVALGCKGALEQSCAGGSWLGCEDWKEL